MTGKAGGAPQSGDPLLTLEPLLDVVREAVEAGGWSLSGVQKTTSYEYEGRWAGESTRSAYLFFHPDDGVRANVELDTLSLDVFLDETRKGMTGNLALVIEGPALEALGTVARGLGLLAEVARDSVPAGLRSPVSARASLGDATRSVGAAQVVFRLKVHIPTTAMDAGPRAVAAVVRSALAAYEHAIVHPLIEGLGSKE
jgi:hypothetical protein